MMTNKYLFICGAPRSGTTALWRLIASDERIIIGVERYGNLFFKAPLTPELFTSDRFCNIQPGDTFYNDLTTFNPYYKNVAGRFSNASYVGDKIPLLYNHLDRLFEQIPDAKVIILLRNIIDIASSYESRANNIDDLSWRRDKRTASAIHDWRASINVLKRYIADERVLPLIYEDFFVNDGKLDMLYKFLEMEPTEQVINAYQSMLQGSANLENNRKRHLPLDSVRLICETAPFGLYRQVLEEIKTSQIPAS
ncbi:sulfotransferase family protein [Methylovulum miyakonense]|uniref:sulfotransferase family protein n=1 Tax=Methylovulum miyakonense TaxID=645578 RepID=UPI0009FCB1D2